MIVVPRAIEANCITGDTAIKGGPGVVYGVVLAATGSANVTLTLYDSADASGERELVLAAPARGSAGFSLSNVGLKFNTAIYADIEGTDAYATIVWE